MVPVDICNLALGYLGDSATVASIDPPEGSPQAQHCARFYPVAQGMLLERHKWNFTTKRVALAPVTPAVAGWGYTYALSADVANVITVLPQYFYESLGPYSENYDQNLSPWRYGSCFGWFNWWAFDFEQSELSDYRIEQGPSGQLVILSNVQNAICRYTSNQVQTATFPAQVANALARLLASMLAGPLLKGAEGAAESQKQYAFYERDAQQAMASDANQQKTTTSFIPSSIQARA